jgi:hypothetical protein
MYLTVTQGRYRVSAHPEFIAAWALTLAPSGYLWSWNVSTCLAVTNARGADTWANYVSDYLY